MKSYLSILAATAILASGTSSLITTPVSKAVTNPLNYNQDIIYDPNIDFTGVILGSDQWHDVSQDGDTQVLYNFGGHGYTWDSFLSNYSEISFAQGSYMRSQIKDNDKTWNDSTIDLNKTNNLKISNIETNWQAVQRITLENKWYGPTTWSLNVWHDSGIIYCSWSMSLHHDWYTYFVNNDLVIPSIKILDLHE